MVKSYESNQPCIVCGVSGEGKVCFHHIYTRKSYPEFSEYNWNMIPVCQKHHNEFHNKGNQEMARKYSQVKKWFDLHGWEAVNGKLLNKENKDD